MKKLVNFKNVIVFMITVAVIIFTVVSLTIDDENRNVFMIIKESIGILANFTVFVGVSGIIFTYLSREDALKLNEYNVLNGLMSRYSILLPELLKVQDGSIIDDRLKDRIILQYFNLTEEQLFYISKDIVPERVISIWISGIIDQLNAFGETDDLEIEENEDPEIPEEAEETAVEYYFEDLLDENKFPLLFELWQMYLRNGDVQPAEIIAFLRTT
jgi:hypothetical protein